MKLAEQKIPVGTTVKTYAPYRPPVSNRLGTVVNFNPHADGGNGVYSVYFPGTDGVPCFFAPNELTVSETTIRYEQQYAIRTENFDGTVRYKTMSEYGLRNPPPSVPLTYNRAVEQIELYNKDCNPTVVVRAVAIIETPWDEVK